jgi:hypothetical protein
MKRMLKIFGGKESRIQNGESMAARRTVMGISHRREFNETKSLSFLNAAASKAYSSTSQFYLL